MKPLFFLLALLPPLLLPPTRTAAGDLLTWDTNSIGSPVSVYRGELLGVAAGNSYALPTQPPGTTLLCIGSGGNVLIYVTNYVTLTNWVQRTNTVTLTNTVSKTNIVTVTNIVNKRKLTALRDTLLKDLYAR